MGSQGEGNPACVLCLSCRQLRVGRVVHELSLAQGIFEIVQQYVPLEQAPTIRKIQVKVGRMSGVVPESLEFSFSAIVADTPWRTAQLDILHIATVASCSECGAHFEIKELVFHCPHCGSPAVRLISGRDVTVAGIEVDGEKREGL